MMQLDLFLDPFRRCLPVRQRYHVLGGFTTREGIVWLRASKGDVEGRVGQRLCVSTIFVFDAEHRLAQRMKIEYRSRFFPNFRQNNRR